MLNLIERLRERGLGVLLISHNLADVQAVADRAVVLRLGRNNGEFRIADVSYEDIIAAITGATDNVVTRREAAVKAQQTRRPRRTRRRRSDPDPNSRRGNFDGANGSSGRAPDPPDRMSAKTSRLRSSGYARVTWAHCRLSSAF